MAYVMPNQNIYTLRLWMFLNDRYYMIPKKEDPSKFMVFSREPVQKENFKRKYHWNIVGSAEADSEAGLLKIQFDLIESPIYMSLFPEAQASSSNLPDWGDEEVA